MDPAGLEGVFNLDKIFFLTLHAPKTKQSPSLGPVCPSRQGSGISPAGIGTKRLDFAAFTAPASDQFIVNVIYGAGLHAVQP